jgi:hypothetical protein
LGGGGRSGEPEDGGGTFVEKVRFPAVSANGLKPLNSIKKEIMFNVALTL